MPPRRPVRVLPVGGEAAVTGRTDGNYRIHWEGVGVNRLHLYMNRDPRQHMNCRQTVPNSSIPEAEWHRVSTMTTTDPWAQYNELNRWEKSGYGFIRNVHLYREFHPGQWSRVDRDGKRIIDA